MDTSGGAIFDPEVVRERYLAERDKRLVPSREAIADLDTDPRLIGWRTDPFTPRRDRSPETREVEVAILGAGIAGLSTGARLREAGVEDLCLIDAAGGVGGTWYWNRYPGVMCDVESYLYLPLLEEMGTIPSARYASGPEILAHLEAIAERYELTKGALFHTEVIDATWQEDLGRWRIRTDRGDEILARYYVLAVGILNLLKLPDLDGMEHFVDRSFHSARWNYALTGGAPGEKLDQLRDKSVAVIGNGASGIQTVRHLGEAAREVFVFQRTPSAIGVRDNEPTPSEFSDNLVPGWQRDRMDNFQAIMMGKKTETDLVHDGWTQHYARVQHPPRTKDMSMKEYLRGGEELDFEVMEEHRRRIDTVVADPATAAALKPWYRYLCKRPCFHDEYLEAFNRANVHLVDCPAGVERISEGGPVVEGREYPVDLIIYATGFEPELTPLFRRIGHELRGRDGITLAEKWGEGASSLFGMMTRGFPNLFVLPAPGQQAVVTVNYTQLAVAGADFISSTVAQLRKRGTSHFDVNEEAESEWTEKIVASFIDPSALMSLCTPSRINHEGHPERANPRNGNFGRGFGDWFTYRDLLEGWVAAGTFEGLDVEAGA